MQQDTLLQQWEASLPIGTALDRLDFIDEPLHHPVAPRQAASVSNSLCIISEPIGKSDQRPRSVRVASGKAVTSGLVQ